MTGFRFQDPLWLALLPLIVLIGWQLGRRRVTAAVTFSSVALLKTLPPTFAQQLRRVLPWLAWLGLAMLVVALARPQMGREEHRVQVEGIAIEMCIDRSGSMRTQDFQQDGKPATRLDVVKKTFRQFVDGGDGLPGRPNDFIGLIDFGGYVDVKCPLTLDHVALDQLLDTVKIIEPVVDAGGRLVDQQLAIEDQRTAIGDALATAVDRLKPVKAKSKIIILLSDGVSNIGVLKPEEAARIAKTFGIKVYTIGIGTNEGSPVRDPFGNVMGIMPARVEFDEEALKEIAKTTGGEYFNVQNTETLKNVVAKIDELEKTKIEGRRYTSYKEYYGYALYPGFALVLLEIILATTRFRTLP